MDVPPAAEFLFELKPEEFTAERDRLAKELKKSGDDEQAAAVKALKRPSVTAYALNRVSRRYRELIDDVLAAGERMRTATSRGKMDEAKADRQKAIAEIASQAAELLAEEDRPVTAQVREKITETLLAAAIDDGTRESLKSGTLLKEAVPSGFGGPITAFEPESGDDASRKLRERAARLRAEAEAKFAEAKKALADSERALREAKELEEASAAAKERSQKLGNIARKTEELAKAKLSEAEELENR
ncbi:MAG TPA: hypothetical protein VHL54_09010 [Actinomycetota bacterium]|nr:hypothetical protein [Actinomycetota bacterium]